jgi:hypothetical protein
MIKNYIFTQMADRRESMNTKLKTNTYNLFGNTMRTKS